MMFAITMKLHIVFVIVLLLEYNACYTKILRNPELMSRMMSDFHKDNTKALQSVERIRKSYSRNIDSRSVDNTHFNIKKYTDSTRKAPNNDERKVLSVLQNVLCNNFPSIPCSMIVQDPTLKRLIERSIQQVNYKKLKIEKTTQRPQQLSLTLFPDEGRDNFSNLLTLSDARVPKIERKDNDDLDDTFNRKEPRRFRKKRFRLKHTKNNPYEKAKEKIKNTRKDVRKVYPRKKKYKDKALISTRDEFTDYSGEKLSMSVEVPDLAQNVVQTEQKPHFAFKLEQNPDQVWRIDYMKHSGPEYNMFGPAVRDDSFRGKLIKTGPNVVIDDEDRSFKKEVLHSDVYIKKNLGRRQPVDLNSDGN